MRPILIERLGHSLLRSESNGVAKKILSTLQVLKVNVVPDAAATTREHILSRYLAQFLVSMED